jgi:hypothetical protein
MQLKENLAPYLVATVVHIAPWNPKRVPDLQKLTTFLGTKGNIILQNVKIHMICGLVESYMEI